MRMDSEKILRRLAVDRQQSIRARADEMHRARVGKVVRQFLMPVHIREWVNECPDIDEAYLRIIEAPTTEHGKALRDECYLRFHALAVNMGAANARDRMITVRKLQEMHNLRGISSPKVAAADVCSEFMEKKSSGLLRAPSAEVARAFFEFVGGVEYRDTLFDFGAFPIVQEDDEQ